MILPLTTPSFKNSIPIFVICLLSTPASFAQESTPKNEKSFKEILRRGEFYASWGYNRDIYSPSNIHFHDNKTDNYDFTVYNALAHDQPDYNDILNTQPTIPQYNMNFGFLFNDKHDLGFEISWDHLKYVVQDPQIMHISGDINGRHIDKDTVLTLGANVNDQGFFHYEHTNGNNYLMASLVKRFKFYETKNSCYNISLLIKPGAGILIPKTDTHVDSHHNDGLFRYSGITAGVDFSLRQVFFRYFHISTSLKTNVVDYHDVKLWGEGRAKQTFTSLQYILSAGAVIPLSKRNSTH